MADEVLPTAQPVLETPPPASATTAPANGTAEMPGASPSEVTPSTTNPSTTSPSPSSSLAKRGREQVDQWGPEVWARLDRAVTDEYMRTRVGGSFLETKRVPDHTTTVAADQYLITDSNGHPVDVFTERTLPTRASPPPAPSANVSALASVEGLSHPVIELSADLRLTPAQMEQEGANTATGTQSSSPSSAADHYPADHSAAVTLATAAVIPFTLAEDMVIFEGLGAFSNPLFGSVIRWRANVQPTDYGLLNVVPSSAPAGAPAALPEQQVIRVALAEQQVAAEYGNNTFKALNAGLAALTENGHYGRYVFTLHPTPYADTFAPLQDGTLVVTADRIRPLVTGGFNNSGALGSPGVDAASYAQAQIPKGAKPEETFAAAAVAAAQYALGYGAAPGVALKTASNVLAGLGAKTKEVEQAFKTSEFEKLLPSDTAEAAAGLPAFYGSLVALDGNTVDLVAAIDPTVTFVQKDTDQNTVFRVFRRFALRIKDYSALVRLEFDNVGDTH
jgi:hypothetical protein